MDKPPIGNPGNFWGTLWEGRYRVVEGIMSGEYRTLGEGFRVCACSIAFRGSLEWIGRVLVGEVK